MFNELIFLSLYLVIVTLNKDKSTLMKIVSLHVLFCVIENIDHFYIIYHRELSQMPPFSKLTSKQGRIV